MNDEEQLSEKESLQLITRMIYEAKGYFYESGIGSLVYGFSTVLCSVLAYMRETGRLHFPFQPFYLMAPVFIILGWIQYQEDKKKKAKTFTDEAIDYIWTGFFIAVIAALCAGFAGVPYIQISFIIILAGLATFLTGMLAKWRYLTVSSFICWGVGIISFFILSPAIYLLLAAVAILMWIVPGFFMRAYFKKQQHG